MAAWAGLACVCLVGCADVRTVSFEVVDKNGEPARGARIMAVRLETGGAPLPINDAVVDELLVSGKTSEQGWTDERGVARLRLAAGRPYLVQAHPPMFAPEASMQLPPARYRLDADGASFAPIQNGASWAGEVRVVK